MENFTAALGAPVMATTGFLVETYALSSGLLRIRRRAGRLNVSSISEHGYLNANFRNAMFVLVIVERAGARSSGRS